MIDMKKLHAANKGELGASSLLIVILTSAAVGALIGYFNDDVNQTRNAKVKINFSEGMDNMNIDIIQRVSQLIQSETIKVAIDKKFTWDADANVNSAWSPATSGASEISFKTCNFDALPQDSQMVLANTVSSEYDAKENHLCTNFWVATAVKIDDITTTGTDEFATISIASAGDFFGSPVKNSLKAKIQLGKAGGAVAIPANCVWEDTAYRASFWVQGGRHMAGWTVLGKGVNLKHNEIEGHTSSEWRADVPSGHNARGDTATHTVKGQRYIIAKYEYNAYVYTPKAGFGTPGECFLSLTGVRHNCWGCGCFTEKTKITMGDGSIKEASKIVIGDMVLNPVRNTPMRVKKTTFGKEYEPLVELVLGNRTITVTSLHPFMTANGLKQAKHLTVADEIVEPNGTFTKVSAMSFHETDENTWVYNFALDTESGASDDHMVLADGIVTGDRFLQDKLSRDELTRTANGFNLYQDKKQYLTAYRPGF